MLVGMLASVAMLAAVPAAPRRAVLVFTTFVLAPGVWLLPRLDVLFPVPGKEDLQLLGTPEGAIHDWGFYYEWDFAPLTQIGSLQRAPLRIQDVAATNGMLFAPGTAFVLVLVACGAHVSWKMERSRPSV